MERLATALSDRYRIERELGAGGMATVYLADDVRHRRKVALKVLRPELAAVIGADRFLHEITTTANLQHPHILSLHDSGEVDGTVFYVMPFIPGESLRDRLTREKQLPVDEAVRIAREVASALDYANRQGVIHRDIKPENILLHDGSAVVADFGIALAASRTGGTRMTETGMSLGTPHYMSPEQAMGERELGPRSDIYALGCVAYEMLIGEPPFTGPTPQAIVARAITDPPRSLRSQRASVPEHVEAAIMQALEKLPADRFATAGAFAEALGRPTFTRATSAVRPAIRKELPWKPIALGMAGLVIALAGVLWSSKVKPVAAAATRPPVRFEITAPESLFVTGIVMSRDGSRLLILSETGPWLHTFADMRLRKLDIQVQGYTPSVDLSPDGESLAYLDGNTLKVVRLDGGNARTLADRILALQWADDGFIYVRQRIDKRSRLARVPDRGGQLEELLVHDDTTAALYGFALPGGKTMLVAAEDPMTFAVNLSLLDLRTKKRRVIANPVQTGNPVSYTQGGHVVMYARDAMYAVPFDLARGEFTGAAVPIVPGAPLGAAFGAGVFAYTITPAAGPILMNRRGARRELPGAVAHDTWTFSTATSPTGHAFAFWRYEAEGDRWDTYAYRFPSGPLVRLSTNTYRRNGRPSWSPDGSHVLFVVDSGEHGIVYRASADGSTPPEHVLTRPGSIEDISMLPSGKSAVVQEVGRGLVLVSLEQSDSGITLVASTEQPQRPRVSSDGHWLAYTAVTFGRREVFVRPIAGGPSRWQVSRSGGAAPAWSRSGRELYFVTHDSLYGASFDATSSFSLTDVRALFPIPPFDLRSGIDVLPGDSLFVLPANEPNARDRISVTVNFDESVRALAGSTRARR